MKSHPFWHQLCWAGSALRGSQFFSFGGGRSSLRGSGQDPAPPGEGSLDPEAALAGAGPRRERPPRGGPGGAPRGKGRSAPSPRHGGRREKGSARRAMRATGGRGQGRRPAPGMPPRAPPLRVRRPLSAPVSRPLPIAKRLVPKPFPPWLHPAARARLILTPFPMVAALRAPRRVLWLETRKRRKQLPAGRAGPGEPRGGN